jgi:CheY-like chemotaxis protein
MVQSAWALYRLDLEAMVSQISQPRERMSQNRLTVMIVEDEQTTRRALSRLLSTCGYRPRSFGSAEEALGAITLGERPRVALVDLDLPGMSGLDFIRKIGELDPAVQPILVTATDEETLFRRLAGRPIAYLRKPIDFETLLGILARRQAPALRGADV